MNGKKNGKKNEKKNEKNDTSDISWGFFHEDGQKQ